MNNASAVRELRAERGTPRRFRLKTISFDHESVQRRIRLRRNSLDDEFSPQQIYLTAVFVQLQSHMNPFNLYPDHTQRLLDNNFNTST